MTEVTKQDSNSTALSYAVEASPGVLGGSPVWIPLEPNSYKEFGGAVKTVARQPINASRQQKKGAVVDLDAKAGFIQDLTPTNLSDAFQSVMFALFRTKGEFAVTSVDGTANKYVIASGGDYRTGDLLFAKGFTPTANDGLKKVAAGSDPTDVPVTDTGLLDGTGGTISRVGIEFASGIASIANGGIAWPVLTVANVAASGVLTSSANYADGETVTIGGKVYTLQSTLTNVDGHVKIGANEAATLANLHHAINASGGTVGTDYATATTANAFVTATDDASHAVTVTARVTGAPGNLIATIESSATAAWGSVTLTGGVGRDLTTLGVLPGEWIVLGDDAAGTAFATAADNGFARVDSITANTMTFSKTQFPIVTDAGTAKTIRLLFGRVVKNENLKANQVSRTLQFERTLGAPDDSAPAQIQSEYVLNALPDQAIVNLKNAAKVEVEFAFLGGTYETRSGVTGVKGGSRPALAESDCFNATSDVPRITMGVYNATDSDPLSLFSFVTDVKLTIKNNIKQNKAVGVLGAFSTTPGIFAITADVTAYFADVAAIASVQANDSITLDFHMVKFNKGISVDVPLVVLSKALADVKLNEPITLPLQADAATAALLNANTDHTLLLVFWDYLPNLVG